MKMKLEISFTSPSGAAAVMPLADVRSELIFTYGVQKFHVKDSSEGHGMDTQYFLGHEPDGNISKVHWKLSKPLSSQLRQAYFSPHFLGFSTLEGFHIDMEIFLRDFFLKINSCWIWENFVIRDVEKLYACFSIFRDGGNWSSDSLKVAHQATFTLAINFLSEMCILVTIITRQKHSFRS